MVERWGSFGQMLQTMMVGKEPVNRAKKFDPNRNAYRPLKTDRMLEQFMRNDDVHDDSEVS
jgi:hypothetical protein